MRAVLLCLLLSICAAPARAEDAPRLRVIVETDAGGDPDDEQSMVRFLLYANEWDVEGIIANRPIARPGENRNVQRTGLGIVRQLVEAYGKCQPNLVRHDPRYPTLDYLMQRTVSGYQDSEDGVNLIIRAVDRDDPRPVWFMNWGTDNGAAESCLKRALDKVLADRGPAGYAKFKSRLRLSSYDKFGDHTTKIDPPFPLFVDTFRPEIDGDRWYHCFSRITAGAGDFDLKRDVLEDHGPLGALYPTNTNMPQKEGDTMTFLYLVPNGLGDPEHANWGSWAGRYGLSPDFPGRNYYWANQTDAWVSCIARDNTLQRWAHHIQNDFRARMEWCVKAPKDVNHAPIPKVTGDLRRTIAAGQRVNLDASGSADPDQDRLRFEWIHYPEPGGSPEPISITGDHGRRASFVMPALQPGQSIHIILIVTDNGEPPLTRYKRIIIDGPVNSGR